MGDSKTLSIIYLVIGVLLLSTIVAFPLGHDQALFTVGGRMIAKLGSIPYRDYLDMKPPGIFYIYAFANSIVSDYTLATRVFDLLFQLLCIWVLFKYVLGFISSFQIRALTVLIYAILYVCTGYWNTTGAESFGFLPSMIIFLLTMKIIETQRLTFISKVAVVVGIGICSFVLLMLKFTLISPLIVGCICIFLYSVSSFSKKLILIVFSLSFTFTLCFLYYLYLDANGASENFKLTIEWLPKYASITPIFSTSMVSDILFKKFPSSLINAFSLSSLISVFVGGWVIFWGKQGSTQVASIPIQYKVLFWLTIVSLLSVISERKLFVYHYSRVFWMVAPFAAIGVMKLVDMIVQEWTRQRIHRYLVVGMIIILLFYSPLLRVYYHPVRWSVMRIQDDEASMDASLAVDEYNIAEVRRMANLINANSTEKDQIFIWGNLMEIYCIANKLPTTLCLTNPQFISPWSPTAWKNQLLRDIVNRPPKLIICEQNDERQSITGTTKDSYSSLQRWSEMYAFIQTNYRALDSTSSFIVYTKL